MLGYMKEQTWMYPSVDSWEAYANKEASSKLSELTFLPSFIVRLVNIRFIMKKFSWKYAGNEHSESIQ